MVHRSSNIGIYFRRVCRIALLRTSSLTPLNKLAYRCLSSHHTSTYYAACEGEGLQKYFNDLLERGLISYAHPPSLCSGADCLAQLPNCLYAGFDPTTDSLHIGNLLILANLLKALKFNCTPIAVLGGATAFIGDPSGRTSERAALDKNVVLKNKEKIHKQIKRLADNFSELFEIDTSRLILVDNMEWYSQMGIFEFLNISRSFRVGEMLRIGPVKARMSNDHGLSYSEFSYQILQSYDWYLLSQKFGCFFQIGGSDQLGHLDSGRCYIRKMSGKFAAGACLPLITDEGGSKLGKSQTSSNAHVWIDPNKTSPYALYQYFMQKTDSEIVPLLRFLSLRGSFQIKILLENHATNLGDWVAQKALAEELTQLVHGKEGLALAKQCSEILFDGSLEKLQEFDEATIEKLFGVASTFKIHRSEVSNVGQLANLTRRDRRLGSDLMRRGSLRLNGQRYVDPDEPLNFSKVLIPGKSLTVVCWGKRNYVLVRWI